MVTVRDRQLLGLYEIRQIIIKKISVAVLGHKQSRCFKLQAMPVALVRYTGFPCTFGYQLRSSNKTTVKSRPGPNTCQVVQLVNSTNNGQWASAAFDVLV